MSPDGIRRTLEARFGEGHPLIKIAFCESVGFRQFNEDGTILRGKINPQDVGLFQINEHYHLEASRGAGINIYTLNGNIDYAERLYKEQGTRPWNWSRSCWGE